jgi:tetratricopeptide (TPR) repeat protein
LLLAIFAAYAQVRTFDFIRYDDPVYVSENFHVISGVTWEGLKWAFTSVVDANWIPLTILSHMFDCQLFGLDSGWHHLVNVFLHALAALLLFAALRRTTRAPWPSAFVAFVFALHPLHVESAAWISERKDVLSAFFWFLALYLYIRYAERPDLRRYLLMTAAFCLGLMAKPMLVTFPFTLLLLDVWPLRRAKFPRTLLEKIPLFALALASSIITFFVQRSGGAMRTFPLAVRLENALISYAVYLGQTFWPAGLAVFYPYPQSPAAWQAVIAAVALAAITVLALRNWSARPYLAIGWLWYLGTLVPVIGLVQVGSQSRADRYTYIPMIGISIMLAWGAADVVRKWPRTRNAVMAPGAAACLACLSLTWLQAGYWQNSETLFQHALDVTQNNATAELNLGSYLMSVPGRASDSIAHLQAALRIDPANALAHGDLGGMLENQPGRLNDAIAEFREAIRLDPKFAASHDNLANALAASLTGLPEAVREYQTALRLDPNDAETHFDFGRTLARVTGGEKRAVEEFQAALRINPNLTKAREALLATIPPDLASLEAQTKLNPDSPQAHFAFALGLSQTAGRAADAIAEYQEALRLKPDCPEAHNNLGVLLVNLGRTDEAIPHFEAATRLRPDYQNHRNLGIMLSKVPGKQAQALHHLEAAEAMQPTPELEPLISRLRGAQR